MRYNVDFEINGMIEVTAESEDEADRIIADMDRSDLLKDYDDYGFTVTSCEMDEGE